MGSALERIAVPTLALLASAVLFGLLLGLYAGVNPLQAYALMYQGAFGSWFSFQNTLTRAAPLILTALCTALPARLGLVIIGNEGALVVGGVAAAAAGVAVSSTSPLVVQLTMAAAAMIAGGTWIALAGRWLRLLRHPGVLPCAPSSDRHHSGRDPAGRHRRQRRPAAAPARSAGCRRRGAAGHHLRRHPGQRDAVRASAPQEGGLNVG